VLLSERGGRGAGRDCFLIEFVGFLGPIPSLQRPLSRRQNTISVGERNKSSGWLIWDIKPSICVIMVLVVPCLGDLQF